MNIEGNSEYCAAKKSLKWLKMSSFISNKCDEWHHWSEAMFRCRPIRIIIKWSWKYSMVRRLFTSVFTWKHVHMDWNKLKPITPHDYWKCKFTKHITAYPPPRATAALSLSWPGFMASESDEHFLNMHKVLWTYQSGSWPSVFSFAWGVLLLPPYTTRFLLQIKTEAKCAQAQLTRGNLS